MLRSRAALSTPKRQRIAGGKNRGGRFGDPAVPAPGACASSGVAECAGMSAQQRLQRRQLWHENPSKPQLAGAHGVALGNLAIAADKADAPVTAAEQMLGRQHPPARLSMSTHDKQGCTASRSARSAGHAQSTGGSRLIIQPQRNDDQPIQAARDRQAEQIAMHMFGSLRIVDYQFLPRIQQSGGNATQALHKRRIGKKRNQHANLAMAAPRSGRRFGLGHKAKFVNRSLLHVPRRTLLTECGTFSTRETVAMLTPARGDIIDCCCHAYEHGEIWSENWIGKCRKCLHVSTFRHLD